MAIKEMSVFYSDNEKRKAVINKNLESGMFHVVVYNDMGSTFSTVFEREEDAEQYAEDWVML
jgi:hypothetical protein